MTREFLYALLDPKKTPRVPRLIRRWARACLKHHPSERDIEQLAKKCPKILGDWK